MSCDALSTLTTLFAPREPSPSGHKPTSGLGWGPGVSIPLTSHSHPQAPQCQRTGCIGLGLASSWLVPSVQQSAAAAYRPADLMPLPGPSCTKRNWKRTSKPACLHLLSASGANAEEACTQSSTPGRSLALCFGFPAYKMEAMAPSCLHQRGIVRAKSLVFERS